jgi:hypothetical protein
MRNIMLTVGGTNLLDLIAYCNSDFGNSIDDACSTSGHAVFIGNGCFTWAAKKQTAVVLSYSLVMTTACGTMFSLHQAYRIIY